MKNVIMALLGTVALAGCIKAGQPAGDRVLTVAEYREQPELRKKVLDFCANDPGRTVLDPNCINVREAERMASFGTLANMPRIVP